MASSDLTAVMDRLARADERRDREWKLTLREHRLNRRAYEEGIALCAQLVERTARMFDEHMRALKEMRAEIRDHRDEGRAQTHALLELIDRIDRLDGGSSPA